MRHRGENILEVVNVNEVAGSTECSVDEVLNAIPQLSITLTQQELGLLIDCIASISRGSSDFASGQLVHFSWVGYDGIPSGWLGPPHYLHSGTADSFPKTDYIPFEFVASGTAALRTVITYSYREGLLESYSYNRGGEFDNCENELLSGFNDLNIGDSVDSVVATLSCSGYLVLTTVRESSVETQYQWRFYSRDSVLLSQSVSTSFIDGFVTKLNFSSSQSGDVASQCSTEEFVSAAQSIQLGDPVSDPKNLFGCGWRTDYFSSDGSSSKEVYDWVNGKSIIDVLTTLNRRLMVEVADGAVTDIELSRF